MEFAQMIRSIMESDPNDHWVSVDTAGTFIKVFAQDLNLRVECSFAGSDIHTSDFRSEWANKLSDSAVSYYYNILYGPTLVKRVVLVGVDGGRAFLPLPDSNTGKVTEFDYAFARIVNTTKVLNEYMDRSGLVTP